MSDSRPDLTPVSVDQPNARPKGCDACEYANPNLRHAETCWRYTESKRKGGRPVGFDGTKAKMPSALAQAFTRHGLDWKKDFAEAIKANKRERIQLWLKLLPYMIATSQKARVRRWKGKPSKAAMIALETLEGKTDL